MNRTTVYLTDELKNAVELESIRRGISEAEVIRLAIQQFVPERKRPRRGGLFSFANGESVAEHFDDYLKGDENHKGFGEW